MYITTRQKKKMILNFVLLGLGIVATVAAALIATNYFQNAGGDAKPLNVVLSNLTASSITVTWVTDSKASGIVEVYEGTQKVGQYVDSRGTDQWNTHYIEVTDLSPSTKYSFKILSNADIYTNTDGSNFEFSTAPIVSEIPTPNPVTGNVKNGVAGDTLIFFLPASGDSYPLSTYTNASGNWVIDTSSLRSSDLKSYVNIDPKSDTEIIVLMNSEIDKGAIAQGQRNVLFDESGNAIDSEVKDVELASLDVYAKLPSLSKLSVIASVPQEEEETPIVEEEETPIEEEPVVEEEEEEIPIVEEEDTPVIDGVRSFRIVSDVSWDGIGGESSVDYSSVTTGEESVLITDITDAGFTISWLSITEEDGYVKYGESESDLNLEAFDVRDSLTAKGLFYSHSVKLSRLKASTKYYYEIYSGDEVVKSGSISTFETISVPEFKSVNGEVNKSLSTFDDCVIYAYLKSGSSNSQKISTVCDSNGKWVLSVADARIEDGSSYFTIDDDTSVVINILTLGSMDEFEGKLSDYSENSIVLEVEGLQKSTGSKVTLLDYYGIK